jgi:CheY-like chemotaxis protein
VVSRNLLRKANVLAVDDQPANLVALDAVLGADHNVIRANSGHQAISLLQKRQDIDVILMDLQMPGMDGFQAATKIMQMEGCQDIPIVFITAVYNEDPFIKQGYKLGAVDYFSKPFDPEILKVKVGIYASFRQRAALLRERERQIRESEKLQQVGRELSVMLKSLRVGVVIADSAGRVCQTNGEVFGICESLEQREGEGGGPFEWWDATGKLLDGELRPLARVLHGGESSHNEVLEIRCLNGILKPVLCSASPLHGLDGRIAGAVLIIQDLTEHRKIEKELQRRISKLISSGVGLEPG